MGGIWALHVCDHWKEISLPERSKAQNRWRGEEESSVFRLSDTGRLGEGGWGQSGNLSPLGLGWSVTTQNPSSTPTGLTQNLGHPPRMAVSPPTAWLQSDCSQSAKRLQTPLPHPHGSASPSLPKPSLFVLFSLSSVFLSPRPLGGRIYSPVWSLAGRKRVPVSGSAPTSPLP